MADPNPSLGELALAHFTAALQQTCKLHLGDDADEVELVVAEAAEIPTAQKVEEGKRRAFSVTFRGPREPVLEQRIYSLEHPDLGRQELFLVPVHEDDEGRYYEAVFT